MPNATINPDEQDKFDLVSLPGAYVVLRRMSYDAHLTRRDMMTSIRLAAQKAGRDDDFAGELKMMNHKVAIFDFKECVVDHNLEDPEGNKLDLTKASTFKRLDPRIGQEIDELIQQMNEPLKDDELGN